MTLVQGAAEASDSARRDGALTVVLDTSGTPRGMGFVVANDTVVTCAHVLEAAGAVPGDRVWLAFPHLPGAPRASAWIDPETVRPRDEQDIAVLRLDGIPAGGSIQPLGSASGCRGHRVSVFGVPDGELRGRFGYAYAGDLLPDLDGHGQLLQLTSANDLTVGFSGAPVIDETTGLAIGMITSFAPVDGYQRGAGVAYATATQTLRQVDSALAEATVCPYRGLAPFTTDHAAWFHGRAEAVQRVISALDRRAVLLLGPSGSGKSSLLHAGVLPELAAGGARPGSDMWTVLAARPGQDLLAELDQAGLAGASAAGLIPAVQARLAAAPVDTRLLLVVDQFEELFTAAGARDLLSQLDEVIRDVPALNVVLVMRDDFYPQLAALAPGLLQTLSPGLVNVPATLTRADVQSIITLPADSVGLGFEPGLVGQIVADLAQIGDDALDRCIPVTTLPLLELALLQLWERRVDGRLTHAGYQRIGRVAGSLTSRCDRSIDALDNDHRSIARRVLTALVRPADPGRHIPAVRRQAPLDELRELAADHDASAVDTVL